MPIFVDTGPLLALAISTDRNHALASQIHHDIRRENLVISDDIFDEFITRMRRVLGHGQAVEAGRVLREGGRMRLEPLIPADRERAWDLFERFGDKVKSLTDCSSAAMMERLQIDRVFSFDNDFRVLGKTVLGV